MYNYSLKGKFLSVLIVVLLFILVFFMQTTLFKIVLLFLAALMIKDTIRIFTLSYNVNDEGLFIKDIFGTRQVCDWYTLEYITITKKNKNWVALVSGDRINYLKEHINNKNKLLLDIIRFGQKNKDLAIHDKINDVYKLGLNLNDEGKIRSKQ